jgi:integron integrase
MAQDVLLQSGKMKLEEQLRQKIRAQGLSPKTFETYWHHCEKYLRYLRRINNGEWMRPESAGRQEIEDWLSHLANNEHVAKNSQNTALQAVLYVYRELLGIQIENVQAMRAKRATHTREVMSVDEVGRLFEQLDGVSLLAAQFMYGAGLRISDVVGLRLKDINFARCQLSIKAGKGDKWRFTSFPAVLHDAVRRQIESAKVVWKHDASDNPNGVSLPDSYRKKAPNAARELRWYYLLPSETLSKGEEGVLCRHHRHPDHIARTIKAASNRAEINTRVTSHVLRHSYATHAHEQGVPMRTLMQLLGHNDIRTTEIYVHADEHQATAAKSPLETLLASKTMAEKTHVANRQELKLRLFTG